ncbi:MAG: putative udp-n-acetylmuramoylalanyl-d-glutamyl-2,6-diaminopimelate--d-alanyl-d-alanyl ligase protein [Thermomicrobiales bacterium]|nr:putative udp-n-acetylmuramoylalanyl-d-glutamyl-2,6-diaminopimelate--d-alanyl-d-alanyl ligase protein [Thermomicrobiales bacterium]
MTPLAFESVLSGTGAVLRGEIPPQTVFTRIERNSQQVQPGDLFIAVRGERFDGHDFVGDAAAAGATAALVRREWADEHPDPGLPLLVVDEPVAALQRLAAWWRAQRDDLLVVGITGSVGKTSTKETVASVLERAMPTYRSAGNLNSEIGLPLSLLDVTPEHGAAVLEMGGAYAFGEIRLLAEIARPKIGVVTNIHPVHLERMGSIEAIAETKAELVDAIPEEGWAVLNGDDPRVRAMASRCRGRVLFYGLEPGNDVRATEVESEGLGGTSFWLHIGEESNRVKVPLIGGHAVELALAAIAVGHATGMDLADMLLGLAEPGVQVRLLIVPGPHGSQLIDDTYNASTPSVMSALGLLEAMNPRRAIAVLGDMRELGEVSEREHVAVGRRAGEVADLVVTFGGLARTIAREAATTDGRFDAGPPAVTSFGLEQREELIAYLLRELREDDVVLLKGSRGLEMEQIVERLRRESESREVGKSESTSGDESDATGADST